MTKPRRLRGRRLQEIRQQWFSLHPLCERCQANDRVRAAVELDHRTPLWKGGADFVDAFGLDDDSNKQGLCSSCHADKTREDAGRIEPGCDVSGWPVDPLHPWNRGQ
jgi:5-methylcytosine-specific restriction protein A